MACAKITPTYINCFAVTYVVPFYLHIQNARHNHTLAEKWCVANHRLQALQSTSKLKLDARRYANRETTVITARDGFGGRMHI